MESNDDPPNPSQYRHQQPVTSSSGQARDRSGLSRPPARDAGPSQHTQPSQVEMTQLRDGIEFLLRKMEQFSGDSRGTKRPAEQKPFDQKPTKEQCRICKKLYANKTTLFRHYRSFHQEMHPEKYHGYTVQTNVQNLDESFSEKTCNICWYVAASQNALDIHNVDVHSNVVNANPNDVRTAHSGVNANNANKFDGAAASTSDVNSNNPNRFDGAAASASGVNSNNPNRFDGAVASTSAARGNESDIGNVLNRLHKCNDCACYFEERSKLDEHMKLQHGFQFVCQICNKNLLYKDIDGHVKDKHPDVYKKKNIKINKEEIEKMIVEKVMISKKGRVRIFICTKCNLKMVDKMSAEEHARGHKKELKINFAQKNKVPKMTPNNDLIILTCCDCDISTGSYDAAVEHAQIHLTNYPKYVINVTQQCRICDLKFEPLCYKKHTDLHYKNKEIHKESFKYFKYRFQLLLTDNWFDCFMDDPAVEHIKSKSIYEHTRSVKMCVIREGAYKLYNCCQCGNFVAPTAVLNHAMNYDTCVKVKCSYPCGICQRQFSSRLARTNHAKYHKSEDTYKIVLFNHDNDKEFNKVLNNPTLMKARLMMTPIVPTNETQNIEDIDNNSNAPKVLYKCLCGLCFVRKENADVHNKICPGKDKKKPCPKCNNLFNPQELLVHCFEHHLNGTQIVIENFYPDVIEIESDEESQNEDVSQIVSSDEDDAQIERFDSIKIEVLNADGATTVRGSSEDETERQISNASEIAVSGAGEHNSDVAAEAILIIEKFEKDDEDENRCDNDFRGIDNEMTDDSQDTVSYENIETVTDVENPGPKTNKDDKLKCVRTNLLLNPLHLENVYLNSENMGASNAEITVDIETVRQQIETTNWSSSVTVNYAAIKQEPYYFNPTDFSSIRSRRSLRQMEMQPASSNLSQEIVELLLTDDEDTESNQESENNDIVRSDENNIVLNEETVNNDMCEDPSINISNTPITEQAHNDGTDTELNDVSHTNNDITPIQIEVNHMGSVGTNNLDCEDAETVLTNINGLGVNIGSTHEELETNDQDYSDNDDDLFVPSGIENRNNNDREVPKDIQFDSPEKQIGVQLNNLANKESLAGDIVESDPRIDVEINKNRPTDEDNDLIKDTNQTEIGETSASTEHVQSNNDVDTQDYVESTRNETTKRINDIADPVTTNEEPPKKRRIDKEFGCMNINLKKELIDETEDGCDKEVVRIKTELSEVDNKENNVFVVNNADKVNYNHCSIC